MSTTTTIDKSTTLQQQTRMNSTNLYVTTAQIILKSDPNNSQTWQDLYRLIPYLRNSLCCVVCSSLLCDPLTPTKGYCQHHLCKKCNGGKKRLKPQCEYCKDCLDYRENRSLKILMQLYKKMCLTLINSEIFKFINNQANQQQQQQQLNDRSGGFERGAANLIQLIKEGATFEDFYDSQGGLPKSTYSILPCIYTSSSVASNQNNNLSTSLSSASASASALSFNHQKIQQQNIHQHDNNIIINDNNKFNSNNKTLYSVVSPGSGNKITIKRKPNNNNNNNNNNINSTNNHNNNSNINNSEQKKEFNNINNINSDKILFKKPCSKPKKGCRCGNATATPGKLTCCGQRCPCYVENKACINCKCRGCRNPHTPDGNKVVMNYISNKLGGNKPPILMPSIQILPPPSQGLARVPGNSGNIHQYQDSQFYKFLNSSINNMGNLTSTCLHYTHILKDDNEDEEITVV